MRLREKFADMGVARVADELNKALAETPRVILTAPPGAGKSTLLPLTILEELPEGKILMLEPRRLAARHVAERMASIMGESCGETIGYRVRLESRISQRTRIEVLTEGILERMLVDDPFLEGVAVVIFDEYHERSLTSDLTLALVLETQRLVRPDLKILVMSATLDTDLIARRMDALAIDCPGEGYGVDTIHTEDYEIRDCIRATTHTIGRAWREQTGDILVFLPGQGEISKCREILETALPEAEILALYGLLSPREQRKVFAPSPDSRRRIILATSIAETSLTINGITTVVDTGLVRRPVFNPNTGLTRLETVRISLDMATQRAGRAGRLAPGVAYRMWSKGAETRMKESREPEILTADLSATVLSTIAWGQRDALSLPWISVPPAGHIASAVSLLRQLKAIGEEGDISSLGRRLASMPCHPRLGRMLCEAGQAKSLAADIAALLEEKDPLDNSRDSDLTTRIVMLRQYRKSRMPKAWQRIDDISDQFRRMVGAKRESDTINPFEVGRVIARAYPERVAMRCDNGQYKLAGGGFAILASDDDLASSRFIAIASMDKRIFLAAPIEEKEVRDMGIWRQISAWDSKSGKAVVREELRFGLLRLDERPLHGDVKDLIIASIAEAAPKEGLTMFSFNEKVISLQIRIHTLGSWHPEMNIPDVSTECILATAHEWLPMYIGNATTVAELRKIDMREVISGLLDYETQQALNRLVPDRINLPSGKWARISYRRGAEDPIVSARLQDCFGLTETPRLDDGKRPVLMELLSPGFKPVQLTKDMPGFWRETYHEVRKELRRRYPKHKWPDLQ